MKLIDRPVVCFDLEMNQPSGRIVQIGAVIGIPKTSEILGEFSVIVNPMEPLCTVDDRKTNQWNVPLHTGITEERILKEGVRLIEAHGLFLTFIESLVPVVKEPWAWGCGDLPALREQLIEAGLNHRDIGLGRRSNDIKSLFKNICLILSSKGTEIKTQGGLHACRRRFAHVNKTGVPLFHGRQHDAMDDAKNTFLFGCELLGGD